MSDSIAAVLNRTVAIEIAGITMELAAPTVSRHLQMRQEQLAFKEENQLDESNEEDKRTLDTYSAILMVKACLVEDVDLDMFTAFTAELSTEEISELIRVAMNKYRASTIQNKEEINKKLKEAGLTEKSDSKTVEEVAEEDLQIPLSSQES